MKWFCLLLAALPVGAADISVLVADREAIERVYYNHRTGEKPVFEKTLSGEQIRELVERDLLKEAVLKRRYGVEISDAQIATEVARINATTRAPEILTELKTALGENASRFGQAVAKPLVVERELRDRFENDDALHAPQRREMESIRQKLLRQKATGAVLEQLLAEFKRDRTNQITETTFQLSAKWTEKLADSDLMTTPHKSKREVRFDELPRQLQQVLRAQLRQAADISAVIEMPDAFALYVAREKTGETLTVLICSIPKQSLEQFVAEQTESSFITR
jgi:hypothetical protein